MKKIFKIFLLSFSVFLVTAIIAIIIIYKIYITKEFVKNQIIHLFKSSFNREISLNITDISLFKGIEVKNLIIYNPPFADERIFIKIDRLKLKYDIFTLLFLKLKINEITFINPQINLQYFPNRRIWNFSDFVKSTPKKEKTEKKKSPIKVSIDMKKFFIKNLKFQLISNQYFLLKGINIYSELKFEKLSISGINKLIFKINTSGIKNIIYKKENLKFQSPLDLVVDINISSRKNGNARINYSLENQMVEINKKFIKIPDIKFLLDTGINLDKNIVKIKNIKLDINKNSILNLSGNIFNVEKIPSVDIVSKSNEFNLSSLNELARIFLSDPQLYISGKFKINKMFFSTDKKKNLPSTLKLALNEFNFVSPKNNIKLNNCYLKFIIRKLSQIIKSSLEIYAKTITANLLKLKNLDISANTLFNKNFKPITFIFNINNTIVNDGTLNSAIEYKNRYIQGKTILKDLNIHKFNQKISGNLTFSNIIAGEINNVKLKSFLNIPNFKFYISARTNKYSSKKINLNFNSTINIKKNLVKISSVQVTSGKAVKIFLDGTYYTDKKKLYAKITTFTIILDDLIETLPTPIKYSIPFEKINGTIFTYGNIFSDKGVLTAKIVSTNNQLLLENPDSGFLIKKFISILNYNKKQKKSNIVYNFAATNIENKKVLYFTNQSGEHLSEISYQPFANKIEIISLVTSTPYKINVKKFIINIPDLNLTSMLAGKVIKVKRNKQNIKFKYNLKFESPETILVLKDSYIQGKLNLIADIFSCSEDTIKINGKVNFDKIGLKIKDISINNINGYFPFTHLLGKKEKKKIDILKRSAFKDLITLNYPLHRGYNPPPDNITVESLQFKDFIINDIKFDINYSDNFLSLNRGFFRIAGGSISINNSYIDLADLKPSNFKYQFNVEISELDVAKFKNIKVGKDEDTKIFANVKFKGRGVDLSYIDQLYGAFNITHIGNELALKLFNSLDPEKKDKAIDQIRDALERGASPKLISMEIKYGQIYPSFWYKRPSWYKDIIHLISLKAPVFILPPSPIEVEPKPIEPIIKFITKK